MVHVGIGSCDIERLQLDRTIIFCAFSGEEYGLYGSAAYAAWCDTENKNILGYLNMDMIGYLKPGDPIHTDMIAPSSAQWLVDFYTSVVNLYLPAFTIAPGALAAATAITPPLTIMVLWAFSRLRTARIIVP
ncbi:MAG: M28 family peptidase [Bacteroidales bacterium]|nr:M28 family peptidase [Bacteroidales bacterium]